MKSLNCRTRLVCDLHFEFWMCSPTLLLIPGDIDSTITHFHIAAKFTLIPNICLFWFNLVTNFWWKAEEIRRSKTAASAMMWHSQRNPQQKLNQDVCTFRHQNHELNTPLFSLITLDRVCCYSNRRWTNIHGLNLRSSLQLRAVLGEEPSCEPA